MPRRRRTRRQLSRGEAQVVAAIVGTILLHVLVIHPLIVAVAAGAWRSHRFHRHRPFELTQKEKGLDRFTDRLGAVRWLGARDLATAQAEQVLRAVASLARPFGWDEQRLANRHLDGEQLRLTAFA